MGRLFASFRGCTLVLGNFLVRNSLEDALKVSRVTQQTSAIYKQFNHMSLSHVRYSYIVELPNASGLTLCEHKPTLLSMCVYGKEVLRLIWFLLSRVWLALANIQSQEPNSSVERLRGS